jgi:hypothetical protein
MTPDPANPAPLLGTAQPAGKDAALRGVSGGSGGGGELIGEVGALLLAGVLVGVIVLVHRWFRLRSRPSMPGLPRQRLLPLSRHGTIHDPKYLGKMLETDEPPASP